MDPLSLANRFLPRCNQQMLDTLSPPILVVWKDYALHKPRGEAVFCFKAARLDASSKRGMVE